MKEVDLGPIRNLLVCRNEKEFDKKRFGILPCTSLEDQ